MERKAQIAGLDFTFTPPGDREQFEIECILAHILAPGAAAGVGELAEALAGELVKLARDVCLDEDVEVEGDEGPAKRWDLARLLHLREHLDSSDPRLERAWEAFTTRLPQLAGDLIAKLTPEVTDRLDHVKIQRLFELVVLGHTFVDLEGVPKRIKDYKAFRAASLGRWTVKWEVMLAALGALYLAPDNEPSEDA